MAIAPVNKFINIAVPVTVGKQKLYEVPTGTSALLLYLQVANVGIAQTFPTVTFTQQRTQRSTGNKREVRVIKDVEIPPNDAAIIVDGRLVLEKTPLVLDKIFIEGTQQQTGIVTFVEYHEPTGIATIVTKDVHPFKPGDPITLAGLAFTCIAGQTGITTNIFPDPMQSYSVEDIEGVVGASKTFSMFIGKSTPLGITGKDYSHFYNSAIHYYERSKRLAIEVSTTSGSQTGYTSKTATAGTQATATASTSSNVSGGALTGTLTITNGGAGYTTNPTITFSGGGGNGGSATITRVNEVITQIAVSGGSGYTSAPTVSITAPEGTTYDPATGILSAFVASHGLSDGTLIRLEKESFAFTCSTDGFSAVKKYPRNSGTGVNAGKPDFAYGRILEVDSINVNRINIFIGTSSDTSTHRFVGGQSLANNIKVIGSRLDVEHAIYYGGGNDNVGAGVANPDEVVIAGKLLRAGELLITTKGNHGLSSGDKIRIIDNGIYFSCTMDNRETEHSYPRVTDPASGVDLTISGGAATSTNHFSTTQFVVNVGPSYSGGFFAPLEMELVASILENSTA
tara:strand:- start:13 stop:1716 length:1704 start_codon:yes stop_codon:yes gene_type:complete